MQNCLEPIQKLNYVDFLIYDKWLLLIHLLLHHLSSWLQINQAQQFCKSTSKSNYVVAYLHFVISNHIVHFLHNIVTECDERVPHE